MRVTLFGMGYVGCVTAACLAECGHDVTGIDLDQIKVAMINKGCSPIIEPGLDDLIRCGLESGRLRASCRAESLGDVAVVCVGTPSNENGSLGLDQMFRVIAEIGDLLKIATEYVVINIRSTVLPGTVEEKLIPALEQKSGKVCDKDFGVCMNPEFMRETTAISDFYEPPFTAIGCRERSAGGRVAKMYATVNAAIEYTTIREAEMIKYACNALHAVKVCFANEIGNLSKRVGVDSHRVMDIVCKDKRLNISSAYMKPGFAFGGSCLPKDLRAITHMAKQLDVEVLMLASLMESNRRQIELGFRLVRQTGKSRIGVLGMSFKAGTDDLRESPVIALIELLIGKGYRVKIYDNEVALAKIYGANRRYIEEAIPHISSLMSDSLDDVIESSEVIIVSKSGQEFAESAQKASGIVIDLVRVFKNDSAKPAHYEGICW